MLGHGERELHERGDLRSARGWFAQACRAADRDGDGDALAAASIGLGGLWVHEHRDARAWAEVTSWQRRALERHDVRPELAARLRARLAAEQDYRSGCATGILPLLLEARRRDDPVTLASSLSLAHHCLLGPEHGRLRAVLAEEMLQVASRTARRSDRLMGLLWQTVDRFLDGDPHAERSLGQLRVALEGAPYLAIDFVVQGIDVMLAIRAGELERAEALATECARSGERCGDADAEGWFRGQLFTIRWFQGRSAELLATLRDQLHVSTLSAVDDSLFAGFAVVAAQHGELASAAEALARLGRGDLRRVPSSSVWLATMYGVVEAAALLGDVAMAARAYALLEPHARLPITTSLAVACFGSVEQALGMASMTVGDPGRAVEHFRRAVSANLVLGHRPARCLSRYRLAAALTAGGRPQDGAEAQAERARACREADRLGMVLPEPAPQLGRGTPSSVLARSSSAWPGRPQAELLRPGRREREAAASDAGAQVRLLGPVDVRTADVVRSVPGVRRQTVLAVLGLNAGEVVSIHRLIDVVSAGRTPPISANTIQSHVSFLRRVIGASSAIRHLSGGYLLDLGAEPTDVAVAERLVRQGTRAVDPEVAVQFLQEAVSLWRGQPLPGLTGPAWGADQARQLTHLLLTAHRGLAQARLRLGRHDELVADLEPLTWEHALDEQLHELVILALYRGGQQGRAIEAYGRLRAALREELGIDPSPALQDLYQAILRQDEEPAPTRAG